MCIQFLGKKGLSPSEAMTVTQEHKGSKCYCHMPLQGPPEDKTRWKCHNSGSIKTSHSTAAHSTCTQPPGHPVQSLPHPQSRHPTGFGHTKRTGFSMCLYNPAAQFLLLCLSQSLPAHTRFSCAALSEAQPCQARDSWPSTLFSGQPVKSCVPRRAAAAWPLPLWVTWALAPGLVPVGQRHSWLHHACHTIPPIRTGGLPVWEKILSKQWLTFGKYIWKALKNQYKN